MKITNAPDTTHILNSIPTAKEMGIKTDFMSFSTVIDDIYQDKLGSVLRETCSNALDSHISAGKAEVPFTIFVDEDLYTSELSIRIRDYGVGLTAEEAETYLCTLNSSSKRSDQNVAGCLGLGAKSPFALTNNFKYFCIKNNLKHTVLFYRQDNSVPIFNIVTEECLNEPVGVECVYNIKNFSKDLFKSKLKQVLMCFNVKPDVYIDNIKLTEDFWYAVNEYENYYLVTDPLYTDNNTYITQGSNIFRNPYTDVLFPRYSGYGINNQASAFNSKVIPKFNIGELLFTPSREFITIVSSNQSKLTTKGSLIKADFNLDVFNRDFLHSINTTYFNSFQRFIDYIENLLIVKRHLNEDLRFKVFFETCLNFNYLKTLGLQKFDASSDSNFLCNLYQILRTECLSQDFSCTLTRNTGPATNKYKIVLVDKNVTLKSLEAYVHNINDNIIFIKAKPSCKQENYTNCINFINRVVQQFRRLEPVDITTEFLTAGNHTAFIESLKTVRGSDNPDKLYSGLYTFENEKHKVLRNINPEVPLFTTYLLVNVETLAESSVSKDNYLTYAQYFKNVYAQDGEVIYYSPSKFNTASKEYFEILKNNSIGIKTPDVLVAEHQDLFNFVKIVLAYNNLFNRKFSIVEFLFFFKNVLKELLDTPDETHAWLRFEFSSVRDNLQNLYNKLTNSMSDVLIIFNKFVKLTGKDSDYLLFNVYYIFTKILYETLDDFDFKLFRFYAKTVQEAPRLYLNSSNVLTTGYSYYNCLYNVYNRKYVEDYFRTRLELNPYSKNLFELASAVTAVDTSVGIDLNSPLNKTLLTNLILDEQFYNLYKIIPINDLQS